MKYAVSLCAAFVLLAGCSTSQSSSSGNQARTVSAATPEQTAMLEKVKSLAGTWEMADEKGQKSPIIFAVTSGGSAVREIMFPGSPHEMTNLYHLDGPSLMAVHYCAAGNQPHMRASTAGGDRIEFKFDSVTNKTAADQNYMGQLTIIFKDSDHIREEWQSLKSGKPDEFVAFDLERKKGA